MQWSTRPLETAVAAVAALGLGSAVLVVDPVGRWLVGAAAVALAVLAVTDRLLAPRLRADDEQVVVRTWSGTTVLPRGRLRARVRTGRRLGLRSTTLELEDAADDAVLVVLGRRDLGVDPEAVAAVLLGHTPRS